MSIFKTMFIAALVMLFGAPALRAEEAAAKPIRIVVVGDSTACEYATNRPERGWGHYLQDEFRAGTVQVINLAAAGRSTRTFISEGRWTKALAEKPDYVLIQFGHNDSHAVTKPEATDAATDFRANLRRYIADARAIGATPILVTPMVRRNFDATGKIEEKESASGRSLGRYAEAMRAVAAEQHVAVIDLHARSLAFAEKLGPTASLELANKPGDATHFNEKGARAMLALILQDLPAAAPKLGECLKGA